MPERGFLIFEFFCYRFRNFLPRVEYERNTGINFFSLFLVLSHPVFAENNAGKGFFYFFAIFLKNFLPRAKDERNSGLKFFSLLLGLSHPVLAKNNA